MFDLRQASVRTVKLPSTHGCYLRSRGASYILIMPSTFWVATGLWLLTPILSIPASMQRSQYQRSQRSNSCKRISVFPIHPCCALYFGPRRDRDPRWMPAIVVKRFGPRSFNVRVVPRGPVWRRHIDHLQRRYVSPDDAEPGDPPRLSESREENPFFSEQLPSDTSTATTGQPPTSQNVSPLYGPSHPGRSKRPRNPRKCFCETYDFFTSQARCFLELSLV